MPFVLGIKAGAGPAGGRAPPREEQGAFQRAGSSRATRAALSFSAQERGEARVKVIQRDFVLHNKRLTSDSINIPWNKRVCL